MAVAGRAGSAGASRGASVARCPSLMAGVAGTGNRPAAGSAEGDSVDGDEVVNTVTPATPSTNTALATNAITAPGVPTNSPVPRRTHRRVPGTYPVGCAGTGRGSLPPGGWLPPGGSLLGGTGCSAMAAAGGSEVMTGWKRAPACRLRGWIEELDQLVAARSPALTCGYGPDPGRARPGLTGDWFGSATAITSPCKVHRSQAADQLLTVSG